VHPLGEELARRLGSLFPGRGTASAVALADEARAQEMGGGRTSTAHPWACAGGRAVSDTPPAREAPPEAWRTRLTNNRKCVSRYGCPAGLRDLRVCPPGHAAPRRLFSLRPSPFRSGNYARGPHPQQGGPLVSPVFPRRYRHTLQTRNVRGAILYRVRIDSSALCVRFDFWGRVRSLKTRPGGGLPFLPSPGGGTLRGALLACRPWPPALPSDPPATHLLGFGVCYI
jgi:hypothetical protein